MNTKYWKQYQSGFWWIMHCHAIFVLFSSSKYLPLNLKQTFFWQSCLSCHAPFRRDKTLFQLVWTLWAYFLPRRGRAATTPLLQWQQWWQQWQQQGQWWQQWWQQWWSWQQPPQQGSQQQCPHSISQQCSQWGWQIQPGNKYRHATCTKPTMKPFYI